MKGILPKRIVLIGFSQGGALALHISLRSSYSLGGCITIGSWLPFPKEYPSALSSAAIHLPILQFHGTNDSTVSISWALQSHTILKTFLSSPEPTLILIQVIIC